MMRLCHGWDIDKSGWPWCLNQPGICAFKYLHRLNAAVSLVTWRRMEKGFVETAFKKVYLVKEARGVLIGLRLTVYPKCPECCRRKQSCWFGQNNLRIMNRNQTVRHAKSSEVSVCVVQHHCPCWAFDIMCLTTDRQCVLFELIGLQSSGDFKMILCRLNTCMYDVIQFNSTTSFWMTRVESDPL